ncbi:MAG: serine/threonine protein kinase [Nannocystis sp.]|nr:serine/threonine-protein kinase [Nannocystis sp.]MBA3546424.1 serine/threonine protein kinase [Nannocystis sp.]
MTASPRAPDPGSLMLSRELAGLGETDPIGAMRLLHEVEARLFAAKAPLYLGHYQLLAPIGVGGFGTVYAAHDPRLARKVAIKLLHPEHAASHPQLLLREAQAMARLSHPNVVTVHDVGTYNVESSERGGLFVVMEYIDGETLQAWLTAAPRPWPVIVETFLAAGRGLAAAHAIGLVHRDFKPGNVLLGGDGSVRVADFGLAHRCDEGPEPGASGRPGTPAYMAPELFEPDAAPGPAADQFGFCVALFEALHGIHPFPTLGLPARLRAIAAGERAPVPEDSEVPAWLQAAVVRGLDPDPTRRHAGMPELLRALDPATSSRGVGDVAAIRARIRPIEPGVLRYHEVPVPSAFSVQVMRSELTRLTGDGAPYTLVVELDEANMPGVAVRRHIIEMFADPQLEYVALLAGGDPVKVLSATLIVGQVVATERFAMFDTLPAALAACRAALADR